MQFLHYTPNILKGWVIRDDCKVFPFYSGKDGKKLDLKADAYPWV